MKRYLIILVLLLLALSGCDSSSGINAVTYIGYGPLKLTFHGDGSIGVSIEESVSIPVPFLGTITAGVEASPAQRFGVPQTLTVRYNGTDHVYRLDRNDFDLTLEQYGYTNLGIHKRENDLLIIVNGGTNSFTHNEVPSLQCRGAPSPRLTPGKTGRVALNPAERNNVREGPDTSFKILGQMHPGTLFTVIESPICAQGYIWWQVQGTDTRGISITGWTAEGKGNTYWLEPW